MAVPEWFCVIAGLLIGVLVLWSLIGDGIQGRLESTAEGFVDPDAWDFSLGDTGAGKTRPNGNNGLGNGEDPQPPGNPPVNDGPGTGPGNPGNRGGAKK